MPAAAGNSLENRAAIQRRQDAQHAAGGDAFRRAQKVPERRRRHQGVPLALRPRRGRDPHGGLEGVPEGLPRKLQDVRSLPADVSTERHQV